MFLKSLKLFLVISFLLSILLLGAGCSAPVLDLSLQPLSVAPISEPAIDTVIGVDDFIDLRPQTRGNDNQKWLGMIPGVLWLDIESNIPEIYTPFSPYNAQPMHINAAKSVASALKQSMVSRQIVYLPEDPYQSVDYRLEGTLHRSLVRERCYYYGSFIYAWLTRVLGLPYVSYDIELDLDLRLRAMDTGQIIWQRKITGERNDKFHNVYALVSGKEGKDLIAYNFSEILADEFPEILCGIYQALTQRR